MKTSTMASARKVSRPWLRALRIVGDAKLIALAGSLQGLRATAAGIPRHRKGSSHRLREARRDMLGRKVLPRSAADCALANEQVAKSANAARPVRGFASVMGSSVDIARHRVIFSWCLGI